MESGLEAFDINHPSFKEAESHPNGKPEPSRFESILRGSALALAKFSLPPDRSFSSSLEESFANAAPKAGESFDEWMAKAPGDVLSSLCQRPSKTPSFKALALRAARIAVETAVRPLSMSAVIAEQMILNNDPNHAFADDTLQSSFFGLPRSFQRRTLLKTFESTLAGADLKPERIELIPQRPTAFDKIAKSGAKALRAVVATALSVALPPAIVIASTVSVASMPAWRRIVERSALKSVLRALLPISEDIRGQGAPTRIGAMANAVCSWHRACICALPDMFDKDHCLGVWMADASVAMAALSSFSEPEKNSPEFKVVCAVVRDADRILHLDIPDSASMFHCERDALFLSRWTCAVNSLPPGLRGEHPFEGANVVVAPKGPAPNDIATSIFLTAHNMRKAGLDPEKDTSVAQTLENGILRTFRVMNQNTGFETEKRQNVSEAIRLLAKISGDPALVEFIVDLLSSPQYGRKVFSLRLEHVRLGALDAKEDASFFTAQGALEILESSVSNAPFDKSSDTKPKRSSI